MLRRGENREDTPDPRLAKGEFLRQKPLSAFFCHIRQNGGIYITRTYKGGNYVDDKSLRQTVSASSSGASMAASSNQCTLGAQMGPQTIVVRQVVGEQEQQKVLDVSVAVPEPKPAIEQIIDVFVKNLEVNSVDVITDKVIVRGDLEIKAIYVACTPEQQVLAVEVRNVKWTQDIPILGARRGMDADASVVVEFVDYDVNEYTRAYRHKYGTMSYTADDDDDDEEEACPTAAAAETPAPAPCPPPPCPAPVTEAAQTAPSEVGCTREFNVSIVLKVTAKVLTDREVQIGAAQLPQTPAG